MGSKPADIPNRFAQGWLGDFDSGRWVHACKASMRRLAPKRCPTFASIWRNVRTSHNDKL